jgi:hypothetical protein
MYLTIQNVADVDHYMDLLRASALHVRDWVAAQSGDPLDLLRRIKFDPIGYHPIEDRSINFIEQVNQTWTFAVALAATRGQTQPHRRSGTMPPLMRMAAGGRFNRDECR